MIDALLGHVTYARGPADGAGQLPAQFIADIVRRTNGLGTQVGDQSYVAILDAGPEDIVVLAGKGHEDYQEIHGVKHPFSDFAEARLALAARNASTTEGNPRASA